MSLADSMSISLASTVAETGISDISAQQSTTSSGFRPDPHHSFPPFYTLQLNLTTRAAQLSLWTGIILSYCTFHRLFLLSPTDSIFQNTQLNRRLSPADVRVVFNHAVEQGRAEWVDAAGGKKKKQAADGKDGEAPIYVWWKLPEEWAAMLTTWVEDTGQKGSVLTFYELREGGEGKGWGGEGMPEDCLRKVLQGLVKRGKASVFGAAEEEGVKFF